MSTLRRYSGKADFKLRRYSVLSVQIWVWYSSAGSLQSSETLRRLPGFLAEIAFKVYSVQGESLPLTESLTALWQNYRITHIPRQRWLGKSAENHCEFRVYSGNILSGGIQLLLAGTWKPRPASISAQSVSLFVGCSLTLCGASACITSFAYFSWKQSVTRTHTHTHARPRL